MNFIRIKYFFAVVEYLNFTKAANSLYISQPSLSKQIAILESELGVLLFKRSKKGLELTPAGAVFNAELRRIMPEFEAILEKVKQANIIQGTLFVACVESVNMGSAFGEKLRTFINQATEVKLMIERCGIDELRQKIIDGSADLAIVTSQHIGKLDNISYVEIEQREMHVLLARHHELIGKEELRVEDLKDQTFYFSDRSRALHIYDSILKECQKAGFMPKIEYCPNNETILDYVELGVGVAFFDKSITENRKERIVCYPMPGLPKFSLICVWRTDNNNPELKEFIKFLPDKPLVPSF